jgi:flagellar biosynthetic protein FlhB
VVNLSEKKHPATPKRKKEARDKGQVLKSQDLSSAFLLMGFVILLKYWLPEMFVRLERVFFYIWSLSSELTPRSLNSVMINISWMSLIIMAPIFAVGTVIALAGNYLQIGSLFTLEPLKPQLSRISIIAGAKRMFGIKAWFEMAKSLFKISVITYFLYAAIRDNIKFFPGLQSLEVFQAAILMGTITIDLVWKIALAFLIISLTDYAYQWWDYQNSLKMTQEELKQEFKQTEGDPELKGEIKKRQRAISMRRMMEDLKKADVVITNPTHYAIALRYDLAEHSAPYVVAKGQDVLAQRIKELAKEYEIVIMENKPLARTLYDQAEIGQVVPPELYKAVAEVLAFVYRLKKKKIRVS